MKGADVVPADTSFLSPFDTNQQQLRACVRVGAVLSRVDITGSECVKVQLISAARTCGFWKGAAGPSLTTEEKALRSPSLALPSCRLSINTPTARWPSTSSATEPGRLVLLNPPRRPQELASGCCQVALPVGLGAASSSAGARARRGFGDDCGGGGNAFFFCLGIGRRSSLERAKAETHSWLSAPLFSSRGHR